MDSYRIPPKLDLTPKRHHGYAVLLFIMGTLLPPLAVAARFGIGKDFFINVLLTLCGYIPGHGHNFYIQNIRNNKTHARTPKWAQRYGLVDTSEIQRKERKSQWAVRYNDRTATSALEGMPYEEGQIPDRAHETASLPDGQDKGNGELWNREDESYYAESTSGNSGRWRYPANFDDPGLPSVSKKGKKKDRWARTEDAYHHSEERSRRKKSKKKQRASAAQPSINSRDSVEPPEDADGGHYRTAEHADTNKHAIPTTTNELLNHEL